jgi:glycine C-acetyltransferase
VALACLELLRADPAPRAQLLRNVSCFLGALVQEGLQTIGGEHPALCVKIGDAVVVQRLTDYLYRRGVFTIGFCHPVVPEGTARIRVQVTAQHTEGQLIAAAETLGDGARELKLSAAEGE